VATLLSTIAVIITIVSTSATLGYRLAARLKSIEAKVEQVETRVANLETRVANLEVRITNIEMRITNLETRITNLETRVANLEMGFVNLENRVGALEGRVAALENRVANVEAAVADLAARVKDLEARVGGLEAGFERLERALYSYNELLLKVLEARGALSATEAVLLLRSLEAALPRSASKYYTKEVEERLRALLRKNPEDYTMQDVEELWRIADLMFEEYVATRRRELLDYQAKLRVAAQLIKILFVEPKIQRGERVLKPGG